MTSTQITEASNLAEVTAVLLGRGFMLYRPEADVGGVDFLLRTPEGRFLKCQLKGRAYIEKNKYGDRDIWMVFPGKGNAFEREWYLIPHDTLYLILKQKHGEALQWLHPTHGEYWHTSVSKDLAERLSVYAVKSPCYRNGERLLRDSELTSEMFNLDPHTDDGWEKLHSVGYSIDGYMHFPDEFGGSIMSAMSNYWTDEHEIPDDFFILRILLFFKLREMYWDGMPGYKDKDRCLMLVRKLRDRLSALGR
jgi:hypothetical protein